MTTQELVERLRNWIKDYARGGSLRRDQELMHEAADRLSEMEAENKRLLRFAQHIAKQPLADECWKDHEAEGHDGEPDFEGAYDAIIEQARAAMERQQKGEGL